MAVRSYKLKTEEHAQAKDLGFIGYMRSKDWKAVRERVFALIDSQRQHTAESDVPDPDDPDVLAELITPLLRHDGTIAGYFFRRRPAMLDAEPGRTDFFRLLAKVIVSRYFSDREIPSASPRLVIPHDFYDELDELLLQAVRAGEISEEEGRAAGEFVWRLPTSSPDPLEAAKQRLVEMLSHYEDLVPASDSEQDVPADVQHREIGKAALLRLRSGDLENLAAQHGIVEELGREGLAEALVKKLDVDHHRIAEVVVRAERDDPERGLITRLLPLREVPQLPAVAKRIEPLVGRYYGTRVAQWFVFRRVSAQPTLLQVTGLVRSYTVSPAEVGDQPQLNPNPHRDEITVTLRHNTPWTEVTARRVTDLRAAEVVLQRAGGVLPASALPLPDPPSDQPYDKWSQQTLFLLDFLQREFSSGELSIVNFRVAQFESPGGGEDEDPTVPRIRSVRLRGQHLASHREACQLIVDGRAMLDIELRLRERVDRRSGASRHVSVRFALANNHLAVMTGVDDAGALVPDLHRRLMRLARDAAGRPLAMSTLRPLLSQIAERARQDTPVESADILAPRLLEAEAEPEPSEVAPSSADGAH